MNRFFEIVLFPLTLPLSWVYGGLIITRNKLYDWGVFHSVRFDIPVICMGNITVGGTGKTPHIEYLVRLLEGDVPTVAVLSRGYGRKTAGFRYVQTSDTVEMVGDEPLQLKRKYPQTVVAVEIKREQGIRRLQQDYPGLKLILLDDAFQYRKVIPSLAIVLVDFNRPVWNDRLLPRGRLRDTRSQLRRADTIIVTKCPERLSADEQDSMERKLRLQGFQELYFSTITYADPLPVFATQQKPRFSAQSKVLALTGIAHPKPFIDRLRSHYQLVGSLAFPDHHDFTPNDILKVEQQASKADYVLTTEKDGMRLMQHANNLSACTKAKLYYLPIGVKLLSNEVLFVEDMQTIMENEREFVSAVESFG